VNDSEDLIAKARRTDLDEAELRQLRRTLEGSLEARLVHRAGRDFDNEDVVRPGDDELARRIVGRVVAGRGGRRRKARRVWVLVAAALCAGTAAAAVPLVRFMSQREAQPNSALASPSHSTKESVARSITRAREEQESAAPALIPSATPERTPSPVPTFAPAQSRDDALPSRAPTSSGATATATSAASLFAAANLARREGRPRDAADLYEQLQRSYPGAPETRAADISLGMLQLESGAAASALRHFERYLQSPAADLAPEALWGKSRALVRLRRGEEAKQTWQAIVRQYPGSAYAKAASAKLAGP
jgi:TolA-binding protein